jgi:4-amino-4-deoxychorismate lyase
MNRSRMEFFGCTEIIDLKDIVSVPGYLTDDVYKCRIIYNPDIESVEFERYKPKKIQTLKIVECNDIDYSYKFADRSVFAELQKQRDGCDDILIVKNGFITDTSFSNIVFFDGEKPVTPSTPLLKGTMREKLIKDGKISESDICLKDLQKFQSVKLINAMLDLDDTESIDVNNIII